MMNIDFNIDNYNFNDILNLFKLDANFTKDELIQCKETIKKLHPQNSNLGIEYYNLFNKAYKVLEDKYKSISKIEYINNTSYQNTSNNTILDNNPLEDQNPIENLDPFNKVNTNTSLNASLFNKKNAPFNESSTCYAPYLFSIKMVTIHTEDRDIMKYPSENVFEIELPATIKNTLSIELFDIKLPTFYYNISDYLHNSKFWLSMPAFFSEPIEVVIPSGYYNYTDMSIELANQLNYTTTKELFRLGAYVIASTKYTYYKVLYSVTERRFTIENTRDNFILWFDKPCTYNNCTLYSEQQLRNLGICYSLGFNKEKYPAIFYNTIDPSLNTYYYVKSPKLADLDSLNNTIYMEMDRYNWIDEAIPYSRSTTTLYNNDYNGSVNNSFAKLILSNTTKCYVPVDKFIRILPHMVEKIRRLKFKFRYHNGMLVDFMNQPFNFSLKFHCRFDCKT